MDWLPYVALVALLVVATVIGGAAVRVVVALGDPRAAVTLGIVAVLVAAAVAAGAKGGRWRENPYW